VNALEAVDPDRLWSHLEAEAARQKAEAARIRQFGIASVVATAAVSLAVVLLLLLAFGVLPPSQ
jgi:hypothetical protein